MSKMAGPLLAPVVPLCEWGKGRPFLKIRKIAIINIQVQDANGVSLDEVPLCSAQTVQLCPAAL